MIVSALRQYDSPATVPQPCDSVTVPIPTMVRRAYGSVPLPCDSVSQPCNDPCNVREKWYAPVISYTARQPPQHLSRSSNRSTRISALSALAAGQQPCCMLHHCGQLRRQRETVSAAWQLQRQSQPCDSVIMSALDSPATVRQLCDSMPQPCNNSTTFPAPDNGSTGLRQSRLTTHPRSCRAALRRQRRANARVLPGSSSAVGGVLISLCLLE